MDRLYSTYDLDRVRAELHQIVTQYGWFEDNQISLQSPTDDWHYGCGWVADKPDSYFNAINTADSWEITRFIKEHNLVRTRVMLMHPKTCYTYHKDRTPRVHLAVNTHEHCFHVTGDKAEHVPANGHPYLLDTTQGHTAMNCTKNVKRIHLVGCQE